MAAQQQQIRRNSKHQDEGRDGEPATRRAATSESGPVTPPDGARPADTAPGGTAPDDTAPGGMAPDHTAPGGTAPSGTGTAPGEATSGGDGAHGGDGRHMRADARRNYGRLVEAARKVFADQGGQASMEAVAKQAGVGVGTLYRHFPKRIDLVEAVYRNDVDVLVEEAETSAMSLPPWEALEAWLRAYVAYARAKRTFLNELHEAFEKNPGLKSESRERITEACDQVLARAQSAGEAREDTSGADVMQLVSPMCMSPTLEAEQGDRLLTVILAGLRAARVQDDEQV
jgi:AcrR family transcriptional regulator